MASLSFVEVRSSSRGCWLFLLLLATSGTNLQAQSARAIEVLHQRLLPIFELAGVVYTDADESTGRLKVGVVDRNVAGPVRDRLPALGIVSQLVDIVETEPIVQLTTLNEKLRPVPGGMQIRFSNYVCTLGFPAYRNGVLGFVTNSHCSTKQGSVDGTSYYQPLNQSADEFIGTEIADPSYFKGGKCPRGKVCRYSDSVFAQADAGATFDFGKIAKTDGVNTGSLTLGAGGTARFTIVGKGSASRNAVVNKVGRTTGWTQGKVTKTCANVSVSGTNIVNLCQNIVENTAAVIVQGGDSGSEVFVQTSGDNVTLVGLLWGGNTSGTLFVYSPLTQVEQELGTLTVN